MQPRVLRTGEKPAKDHVIERCRTNYGPGLSTVIESFTADGEWTADKLAEGGFYRDLGTEADLEARTRAEYGV